MVLFVQGHQVVEAVPAAVEGEAKVAYVAQTPLFQQEIQQPVVQEAPAYVLLPGKGVQEVIVYGFALVIAPRRLIHGDSVFIGAVREVRELGSYEIALARMAQQGQGRSPLALAAQIDGSGIEVVHPAFQGAVHQLIDTFLVNDVIALGILGHLPAHTAVAQQTDAVAVCRIRPVFHLSPRLSLCGRTPVPAACQADCSRSEAGSFQKLSSVHISLAI